MTEKISPIETIADCGLLGNLNQLQDKDTWQTSTEVWQDYLRERFPLREICTANMAVYRSDGNGLVFDLLSREGNLFLDETLRDTTAYGIGTKDFYIPRWDHRDPIISAIRAGKSVTIHYEGIRVVPSALDPFVGHVEVNADNYEEEKRLFSAVYGTDNPGAGKRVYLLTASTVLTALTILGKDEEGRFCPWHTLILRACRFGSFGSDEWFRADLQNVYRLNHKSAIRGVRRKTTESNKSEK